MSDLRAGIGEAYQWQAFSGEFTVAPSGRVSLPIVGEIDVTGRTTTELETAIATKLQAKAGLAAKPDASVQIVKFRAFYVMGSVEKPGEYEYRPQLTVIQAISIAGGVERTSPDALRIYLRDAITSRGDLGELAASRLGLLARQARLDAEIKEAATITFPDELRARAGEPGMTRILREEQLLFESRRNGLQAQIATLTKNKLFLQDEIVSLNGKDANTARQLDLMRGELNRVTELVRQGLSPLPRQLEVAQTTAQLESNRLDARIAIIRAQEDISKSERDILDLKTTLRNSALQDAGEVRNKLAETVEKSKTAQTLLQQSEARAPMIAQAIAAQGDKLDYVLFRRTDGKSETISAREDDLVQPGDVLRVTPKLPNPMTDSSVASRSTSWTPTDF